MSSALARLPRRLPTRALFPSVLPTLTATHSFLRPAFPAPRALHSSPPPSSLHPPTSAPPKSLTPSKPPANSLILTLSCADAPGIVHAVTGFVAERGYNILSSAQYGDPATGRFFMRVHVAPSGAEGAGKGVDVVRKEFEVLARERGMDWEVHNADEKPKVLIMVSKIGHCLNDLLFRTSTGQLPIDIPLIVSNHTEYATLAESYGVPFHHLPLSPATKAEQEEKLLHLVREHKIDLVVLARYMQILSPALCREMSGRIINIHHSFLPSFKGARPYHQAYDRGVKIIGATAHFVTADLDEGPIIEQGVDRVDHNMAPRELTHAGSNVECAVLARAVKWVAERRVLMNGGKTVVFN